MIAKLRDRLAFRLTGIALLSAILVSLVLSIFEIGYTVSQQRDLFEHNTLQILRSIEGAAGAALYNFDDGIARQMTRDLMSHDVLLTVRLVTDLGQVLAEHSRPTEAGNLYWLTQALFGPPLELSLPVRFHPGWSAEALEPGRVEAIADTHAFARSMLASTALHQASALLRNFILAAVLIAVVQRVVGQPLVRIARDVARISSADPDSTQISQTERRDEIGYLARRLAAMLDATSMSIDEIRTANERQFASQAAAEEAARRLGLAVRAAGVAIFDADLIAGTRWWSDELREILGYPQGHFVTHPDWWEESVHPEDVKIVTALLDSFVRGTATHFDVEYRIRAVDDRYVWIRAQAIALRPADGAPATRLVGVMVDIDARRRAELEVQRYQADLEALVARRTAELRAAQQELVQAEKLASLGSLVAGIAHEVNTPLGVGITAASNFQDLVRDFESKVSDGKLRRQDLSDFLSNAGKTANIVQTNLERAASLIRSFKQVAVDQTSGERRSVELGAYVNDVLTSLRPQIRKSGHSFEVAVPTPVVIETVPSAIWQTLSNLVMNSLVHAYDAGQIGRLRISVATEETGTGGQIARIVYSDDGKGMAPDVAKRIYDPFFTTKRGQGGSGLGMHIVYNLVTGTLGGRITCDSMPGRGTTFTITIPANDTAIERNAA